MADKIANLRDVANDPPTDWDLAPRLVQTTLFQAKRLFCDLVRPRCWVGGQFDRTRLPKVTDFRIERLSVCPLKTGVSKIGHLRPPTTKNEARPRSADGGPRHREKARRLVRRELEPLGPSDREFT